MHHRGNASGKQTARTVEMVCERRRRMGFRLSSLYARVCWVLIVLIGGLTLLPGASWQCADGSLCASMNGSFRQILLGVGHRSEPSHDAAHCPACAGRSGTGQRSDGSGCPALGHRKIPASSCVFRQRAGQDRTVPATTVASVSPALLPAPFQLYRFATHTLTLPHGCLPPLRDDSWSPLGSRAPPPSPAVV